jgi:tRNA G18 (ribose-2'-O)-methylase SpoU
MLHLVTDLDDPRLAFYREVKDRHLRAGVGLFVAESELVVRRLLESPLRVHSVLAVPAKAEALAALRPDVDVYAGAAPVLHRIVGFPFHRGVLALGWRPAEPPWPDQAQRTLVIEDITDVDNLGALMRDAAAFGVDSVLMSPRCADPYYRKALRTAVGTTFALTVVRGSAWPESLRTWRDRYDLPMLAAVVDAAAAPLDRVVPRQRFGLCVGSEGPGLSAGARELCDTQVTIPMARADSLNVAVAAAVILHHLARRDDASTAP